MLLSQELLVLKAQIEKEIASLLDEYKAINAYNQQKVLESFLEQKINDFHFAPSTGYGYGDTGRDTLEAVYASVFKAEDALVRPNVVSGTHAIYLALKSVLYKNDCLVSLGSPYDTLKQVIGITGNEKLSLIKQGVDYYEMPLQVLQDKIMLEKYLDKRPAAVLIQRSKGYSLRESFSVEIIGHLIKNIKEYDASIKIIVDNCYGEFVEQKEPIEVGADLVAGSLIKNPGGGLATTGGYLVGKKELIEIAAAHLTAPGIGKEVGSSTIDKRLLFQGLFIAPLVVVQALESAVFAARLFEKLGYEVIPKYTDKRADIIQAIILRNKKTLLKFCEYIQRYSPIGSQHKPLPDRLPGYENEVIMAAGTFVQGSSIEFSADGPIKEPYVIYIQGGLTAEHTKIALLKAANALIRQE
ncbi:MAG: methionine gamma-lyase family protein [Bacillota bacterium]